jgi:hypothetical protein
MARTLGPRGRASGISGFSCAIPHPAARFAQQKALELCASMTPRDGDSLSGIVL